MSPFRALSFTHFQHSLCCLKVKCSQSASISRFSALTLLLSHNTTQNQCKTISHAFARLPLTLNSLVLIANLTLKTIDDVVKHAEAFETALHDQSTLQNSLKAYAVRASTYRKPKQQPNQHIQYKTMCVAALNMASLACHLSIPIVLLREKHVTLQTPQVWRMPTAQRGQTTGRPCSI